MGTIMRILKSMRVIWAIPNWLKITHITLIDLKKDLPIPTLPYLTLPL